MNKIIEKPILLTEGDYCESDLDDLIEKGVKHFKVLVSCPRCHKVKIAEIPIYKIHKANNLAQFFVKGGFSCKHNYVIFVDKNGVARSSVLISHVIE